MPYPRLLEAANPLRQPLVVGGDDAPLAAGHVLGALKAEAAGVGDAAHQLSMDGSQEALGVVFQNLEPVPFCDPHEARHIRRKPVERHRQNGLGSGADAGFHRPRIDVPGIGIHVGKNRGGLTVDHRHGGGGHGQRRDDHLVPGCYSHCRQRAVHGGGAVDKADGETHADGIGKYLLQASAGRAVRLPELALQDLQNVLPFPLSDALLQTH